MSRTGSHPVLQGEEDMSEENQKSFNPREHLMQLKSREGSKDYLPVQWRIKWFRESFPHGSIETEMIHLDLDRIIEKEVFAWNSEKRRSEKVQKQAKGIAIFKATVRDSEGGEATSTGSECAVDFDDFIEKAETKSIGRALAALGYGTQFAPELDEGNRIVDAPVDRSQQDEPPVPVNNASASPRNEASKPTTPNPSNVASINNAPSKAQPQTRALQDMIGKAKTRAEKLGVNWEDEKRIVLGKATPDSQLTVQNVAAINGDLTKAEKQAS